MYFYCCQTVWLNFWYRLKQLLVNDNTFCILTAHNNSFCTSCHTKIFLVCYIWFLNEQAKNTFVCCCSVYKHDFFTNQLPRIHLHLLDILLKLFSSQNKKYFSNSFCHVPIRQKVWIMVKPKSSRNEWRVGMPTWMPR